MNWILGAGKCTRGLEDACNDCGRGRYRETPSDGEERAQDALSLTPEEHEARPAEFEVSSEEKPDEEEEDSEMEIKQVPNGM